MKNQTNTYDLTHPTLSGKPGFDLYQNEESDTWYFLLNDDSGKPLLFSEGYTTMEGRDNGVHSVLKNAGNDKRYKKGKDEKGHFFLLRAGNYKEIARSRYFSKASDMENARKYLMEFTNGRKNEPDSVIHTRESREKTMAEAEHLKPKVHAVALPAPRYAFKIELYPRQEDKTVSGKIYNAIGDPASRFNGLDMDAIRNFILSQLPASLVSDLVAKPVAGTEPFDRHQKPAPAKSSAARKPDTSDNGNQRSRPPGESLDIAIYQEGKSITSSGLPVNKPLTVRLSYKDKGKNDLPEGISIPVELNLKSLSDNRVIPVGEYQFNPASETGSGYTVYLPYPGVFRFTVRSRAGSRELEGSLLVAGI